MTKEKGQKRAGLELMSFLLSLLCSFSTSFPFDFVQPKTAMQPEKKKKRKNQYCYQDDIFFFLSL